MKITLKDVAKKAGLSVTTVSRALNGFDDVANETKVHVQATAHALGYTPNLNARRLKTARADAIGLILPSENLRFSDPFFSDLLSGIVEKSAHFGLELNVTTSLIGNQTEQLYLKYMRSRRVDGFIIVRVQQDDPRIKLLQENGFPFVAFGRTAVDNNFAYLDEDGELGIQLVIDHLFKMGHTRIACITEPNILSKSKHRLEGYKKGLRAHNISVDSSLIVETNFRQRSGREATLKLLTLDNPPTAIVCVNDLLALGAMHAIQEQGLVVGKDISVTGFDDILLAEYANPPLTTLHQPSHRMGSLLCEMLYDLIKGKAVSSQQVILPPDLIIRQSTGKI